MEKENAALRQYKQCYVDIVAENNFLRRKLDLVEMSRDRTYCSNVEMSRDRTYCSNLLATVRHRPDPDGQEDIKINNRFGN